MYFSHKRPLNKVEQIIFVKLSELFINLSLEKNKRLTGQYQSNKKQPRKAACFKGFYDIHG